MGLARGRLERLMGRGGRCYSVVSTNVHVNRCCRLLHEVQLDVTLYLNGLYRVLALCCTMTPRAH